MDGGLTLNPIKHLDPIGSLMSFWWCLVSAGPSLFPVNLEKHSRRRKGLILVSSAGIVTNIICAFIALLLYKIIAPAQSSMMEQILYLFARINIMLAALILYRFRRSTFENLMGLHQSPFADFFCKSNLSVLYNYWSAVYRCP